MTYTELVAAIKAWTENTETAFVAQIPQFVKNAEKRIYRGVNLPVTRKQDATIAMVDGTATIATPTDFLANRSLRITTSGSERLLVLKDPSFIYEAYPVPTTKGTPKYYAFEDDNLVLLGPTPNTAFTTEFDYFYFPTSIVTAETTWVGTNADSLLLYGSLMEAYIFMKGEQDLVQYYTDLFIKDLADLKNEGEGKMIRDTYRDGEIRVQAQ